MKANQKHSLQNKIQLDTNGLSGAVAGLAVSALFQPLENIKMGYILKNDSHSNPAQNFIAVLKTNTEKSGWKGLWKGLTPAIVKNSLGSSMYFYVLKVLQRTSSVDSQRTGSKSKSIAFINSAVARVFSCIVLNPIAVVETRFLIPGPLRYGGISDAFRQIATSEGLRTFMKGSVSVCVKEGVFAGIYYELYQTFKSWHHLQNNADSMVNSVTATMLSGLVAGLIATAASHPFEILRARMQSGLNFKYTGMMNGLSSIYMEQGVSAFAKGLVPRLMRKPLINATTFVLYEQLERVFSAGPGH